jgi:signal transduction histidine kinase
LLPAPTAVDRNEAKETEFVLVMAQAFLGVGCVVAIYLVPIATRPYTPLARHSLLLYASFSVLMVAAVRLQSILNRRLRLFLHAAGIFWTAVVFLFTQAGITPIFVAFLLFILLAAAYRWGLMQTLLTAGSCAALCWLGGQALAGRHDFSRLSIHGPSQWTIDLLLVAGVIGFLVESETRRRSETLATNRLMSKCRGEVGMRETLQTIFPALLDLFDSSRISVALQRAGSPQSFLWEAERQDGVQGVSLHSRELAPADLDTFFFPFPAETWCASTVRRSRGAGQFRIMAINNKDERLQGVSFLVPDSFLRPHSFHSLLAASFTCGHEWMGRIFVFDPRLRFRREADLRFLRRLISELVPIVYSRYILGRLRSHVREVERSRVARELHDGPLQSLIALDVEVGLLSRRVNGDGVGQELSRIKTQLASEIQNFRDLMERVKPIDIGPKQLVGHLGDLVDKFRMRTGIAASFVCESEQIELSPRVGHELVRILQEALVNVRKHSGAHRVFVRCVPVAGHLKVTIDDDGRGFDFAGRFSLAELEAKGKGPAVIKERLRSIGGELALESVPKRGARLEVLLPCEVPAHELDA